MGQAVRRRSRRGSRLAAASIALILGGAGLVAVNTYAAAGEGQGPWPGGDSAAQTRGGPAASTIKCPEAANGLPEVPEAARPEVDRELATLDTQITEAYQRFAAEREKIAQDPEFATNAILNPLKDKRVAVLDRIALAIGRVSGERPEGLEAMAPCTLQADDTAQEGGDNGGGDQGGDNGDGQNGGGGGFGGQAGNGPVAGDFVNI
ncbi:hypothetical protein ABZ457_18085, partial [Streptomyces sp. NPDC005805]